MESVLIAYPGGLVIILSSRIMQSLIKKFAINLVNNNVDLLTL